MDSSSDASGFRLRFQLRRDKTRREPLQSPFEGMSRSGQMPYKLEVEFPFCTYETPLSNVLRTTNELNGKNMQTGSPNARE